MYYVTHKNYYWFNNHRWRELSKSDFETLLKGHEIIDACEDEDTLSYVLDNYDCLEIRYWYEEVEY